MRCAFAVSVLILVAGGSLQAGQPTELKALFRAGQTFITWKECGAAKYNIYRAAAQIAGVKDAKLAGSVAKGSSAFALEVKRKNPLATFSAKPGYGVRYVIEDNPEGDPAKMLPEDTGLFVYTPHEAGTFFYAVTAVGDDGKEDAAALSAGNSLAAGVAEKEEPTGAVLLLKKELTDKKTNARTGETRFYTHWMDAADWNPAPDGGYAYNFSIGIPDDKKPRGLVWQGHGYSGFYETAGPLQGLVCVKPGDPYNTWYYGYRDPSGQKVVNYTERRMVMMIEFALRQLKSEGIEVNANKIYLFGNSMAGTAGNFLGAWHGELFCAALACKGAVDHNRNGKWTPTAEQQLWGSKAENLPTNAGDKVWDHVNLIKWHLDNVGKEIAFLLDTHASNDESVPYTAVPEYYEALQKAKRPFVAEWDAWGHAGNQDPHWPNHKWWGMFSLNKDESVPAIGYATTSDNPRTRKGQINLRIEWCARENDFDKNSTKDDILDEPDRWEMCIRSTTAAQSATITPRRCQKFKAKSGAKYHWENLSCANPAEPKKVAEGTVTADEHGLVTVEKFEFDKPGWGNRLVIYPEK